MSPSVLVFRVLTPSTPPYADGTTLEETAEPAGGDSDDDDVPDLVENFDEVAKE